MAALLKQICLLNSIANMEGQGRDDFELEVLDQAQKVEQTSNVARAVKKLSSKVASVYNSFRILMRKYALNVEQVDPQLRNN